MKDNLSDFLKYAYKHNKVKELKDAFDEFPVNEECHKGKIEKIIRIKSGVSQGKKEE